MRAPEFRPSGIGWVAGPGSEGDEEITFEHRTEDGVTQFAWHRSQPLIVAPDFWARIGGRLKRMRSAEGLSQAQFAEEIRARGVVFVQPEVSKIEQGKRHLRVTEALAIADIYGMTVDELLRFEVQS